MLADEIEQEAGREALGQGRVLLGDVALGEARLGREVARRLGHLVRLAVGRAGAQDRAEARTQGHHAARGHGLQRAARELALRLVLVMDVEIEPRQEAARADGVGREGGPGLGQRLDQGRQRRLAAEKAHLEVMLGRIGRQQALSGRRQPVVVAAEHAPEHGPAMRRRSRLPSATPRPARAAAGR